MLYLAVLAVAQSSTPSIGSYSLGQSFSDTERIATSTGGKLRVFQRTGKHTSYFVLDSEGTVRGSLGACAGVTTFVSMDLASFDEFATMLRQRTASWGQPKVVFKTIELADASRSYEVMTFQWAAKGYDLQFSARLEQGLWGSQQLGGMSKCV